MNEYFQSTFLNIKIQPNSLDSTIKYVSYSICNYVKVTCGTVSSAKQNVMLHMPAIRRVLSSGKDQTKHRSLLGAKKFVTCLKCLSFLLPYYSAKLLYNGNGLNLHVLLRITKRSGAKQRS